ncbi:MAG: primosomal protein N' (replication factor Y) - superfamily II helicase, partial [Epsilonproteobacteria bacterium]|nr:primosomal protein N' (replication factor Y) - superfamily II helicase [Campylobacterota bacterium]
FLVNVDGRLQRRSERVQKIRWRRVNGRVFRHFDDVIVGASKRLSRKIVDALAPWPIERAVAYDEKYLTGFEGELYQIDLKDGFEVAKLYMNQVIRSDVLRDIGGDRQEILYLTTSYKNRTFKHLLLPVWVADFKYGGKNYRFAINAVTGKLRGERPYSKIKIFFAVLFSLILWSILFYLANEYGYIFEGNF